MRTHLCGEVNEGLADQPVSLCGWVDRRRDLGGLIFIGLRDHSGVVQVVVEPDSPAFAGAEALRNEFCVRIGGNVRMRPESQWNEAMATGRIEVVAERVELLNASAPMPLMMTDEDGEEVRLKYRYLDLRRPRMQRNLRLRARLYRAIRDSLDERGFTELETPILTKATPEGARDYLVPSRVQVGQFYALPQSPQLFKQLFMMAGMDRYYQIARCFRDEDLRADRQPEFTQVDIEMSFPRMETVFGLVEPLFDRVMRVIGVHVERPFPRLSYADALLRYGTDKPDLRFEMPITDVSDELARLGLANYPGLLEKGARARAIVLPVSGGVSGMRLRKINEELWLGRIVPDARAEKRNLLTLKATEETLGKLAEKGASAEVARKLLEKAGAGKDDTVLVGVDQPGPVTMAMGILRLEMGRELKLVDERAFRFLWVTDFPLFEWDRELGRHVSLHHPFTAPVDEDVPLLDTDPGRVRAKAYDVVLNGCEVGGGSMRIHDSALQAKIFKLLALSDEEARDRFGFFLEALQYGTPPHGGIALGLDRTVMILAGETSLRQVIAFPKTASATDLMTGSPSSVKDDQLGDLGLLSIRK
jgi:aspartyl-tRNA synthetase